MCMHRARRPRRMRRTVAPAGSGSSTTCISQPHRARAAQVRVVEAAKEKLRKDLRSSKKDLAGMVSVQA